MRYYSLLSNNLHSTETVLLRVQNDLLHAVDNEGGAISVLLDLSAAFETIDHEKLLNLLNQPGGIRGLALKWFESYLKDRTQIVPIGSCTSTPATLKYWVPQGSVLSPILLSYLLCAPPTPIFTRTILPSLRGRYSIVYIISTRCISIKGDSNILCWGLHQG